jgi:hypothetical protein
MLRGGTKRDSKNPRFCNPYVGFSQAPEHVEGGSMRKKEVVLDS